MPSPSLAFTSRSSTSTKSRSDESSTMHKHSVVISGHRTSVSLESIFWVALRQIAERRAVSVNRLVEMIDSTRTTNLSSAIRVFVLRDYQDEPHGNA